MELVKVCELTIYTAADVFAQGEPLYKEIIKHAQEVKLAGGTVIKCIEGFASKKRGMGRAKSAAFSSEANLPIVIKIIDARERIEKLLPYLDNIGEKHFLVTLHDIEVLKTKYIRDHIEELHRMYEEE
ncbi:MAG: DUF190 domain-containing protein [Phascolarctobacterium sp.]|nr:DUF190 domain-containing protein [Phascolarctobacterium sp.]